MSKVAALPVLDEDLAEMDRVALRTMQGCMQKGFEDGPKRDRRLWIGDLRLQAQTNYVTFHNNDLVKHDLYLYAGLTMNEGRVGACLFTEPKYQVDDTALFDYSFDISAEVTEVHETFSNTTLYLEEVSITFISI